MEGAKVPISAIDAYNTMLRATVSPELRRMGLVGTGGRYHLPGETQWLLVMFQKSYYSRSDEVSFTINLSRVSKEEWARYHHEYGWPERPNRILDLGISGYGVSVRIGNVMPPNGEDRWWDIRAGHRGDVATQVIAALTDFGVPWLRGELDDPYNLFG